MHAQGLIASISVGVKDNERQFVRELAETATIPDYITIDIAHGHANSVIEMVQLIKRLMPQVLLLRGT